jgi:hypothetical protein
LKKRTDDPATGTGEGKIYYKGAGAPTYDSETVLMLHMDGSDEGTVFTDVSDTAHTVTANGDANTEDSEKKFGVTSAEFDGSGDYLSIPDNSDFDSIWDNDFTLEAWIYQTTQGVDRGIFEHFESDSNRVRLMISGGDSGEVHSSGSGTGGLSWSFNSDSGSMSANNWYHIAVDSYNGTVKIFVNGVADSETDSSLATVGNIAGDINIGKRRSTSVTYFNGSIDELRLSNFSRYEGNNFTPPTESFGIISNEGLYFKDENGTVTPIIEVLP